MKVISVNVGLLLLLILSSLLCFAQSSEPIQPPQAAKELLKGGWDQLDAGDLEGALATANRILEMDPKSGSAAVLHFVAFDNKYPQGNPTADCNRVIELAPRKDWVEAAYITRGNYRLLVRQLDLGIDGYRFPTPIYRGCAGFLFTGCLCSVRFGATPVGLDHFSVLFPGLPSKPVNPGLWVATASRFRNLVRLSLNITSNCINRSLLTLN